MTNSQSNNTEDNLVVVHVSPQTNEMVEAEMAGETEEIRRETKALIEAIKRRTRSEAESAGTRTRETYLNVVRRARAIIEGDKGVDHRVENTLIVMQDEAERNWYLFMKEVAELGTRFQAAAKAAWEAFNHPHSQA